MLNKIILMGRLGRDPEVRYTQSGTPVASFSLAVDRDFKDKASGERATDWVEVVAWQEELLREHSVDCRPITGRNAEEKQAILARLKAYRSAHGLGCLTQVADEAGSPVTADLLRDMLVGAASPNIAQWRQVNEALATLEAWEAVSGGQ